MARTRSLKPEFFRDEKVVAVGPWARLLFAGLWTLADREGRLEEKPGQFKIDLFPCDTVDVPHELDVLTEARLILRYAIEGRCYIAIPGFVKNQHPHPKEPASVIPAPPRQLTASHDEQRPAAAGNDSPRPPTDHHDESGDPSGTGSSVTSTGSGSDARVREEASGPVPPELRGESLQRQPIPSLMEDDNEHGLVLLPRLKAHFRKSGCTNPEVCWRHYHAKRWANRNDPRTWCTSWYADAEAWALRHAQMGGPCQRRRTDQDKARDAELAAKEDKAARRGPRAVDPTDAGDGSGIAKFRDVVKGLGVMKQTDGSQSESTESSAAGHGRSLPAALTATHGRGSPC